MTAPEQPCVYEFGDFRLHPARRELSKLDGSPVTITPKAFDALRYLVAHPGALVTKAALREAVWPKVVVEDNTLAQTISMIRQALGDNPRVPQYIATVPVKGFQFIAEVTTARERGTARAATERPFASVKPHQPTRFCTTPDGVRLAYAIEGEGSPIVRTAHWFSHVEYDWSCPVHHHLLRDLSRKHQLIRYDNRGNGLSDWEVPELSLDTFITDLESVVAATGLQRFTLLGMSMGVPIAVTYAVRHPDRVSHLILYGGTAAPVHGDENAAALAQLVSMGWGQSNPAMRQMFTTLLMPDSTLEEQQEINELQRLSASPENAARMVWAIHRMNVRALLPQVRVPTLVCHAREDAAAPLDAAREVAAAIPGARFVVLETRNHVLLEHDPGAARFKQELLSFIES